ncbi:restriction endonuclease subunit S [Aeribacillus sp. FSL K6-2848]|uniref:restriction endonuclease subunit S n=1 Tax=Aeribacillus sp. FSL K6-2848 TaxID=2954612 RepID=UPI0030F4E339
MFSKYQDKKVLRSLQKNPNWKLLKFSDVLRDETKNAKKIKKEEYLAQGSYPIIDQGKDYIAGFTNDREGVYDKSPLIIFGDHTRILKYIDFPIFIGADGVKLLKNVFSEEEVLTKYIYYYLRTVNIPDTGYNRHFKFLKEVVIPIPNIYLQKRIVFVLDKAQEFIDKRKAQIEALDQLTQSVFLEMFGDPVANKTWERRPLKDITDVRDGTHDSPKYVPSGYPLVTSKNIKNGKIDLRNVNYISEEDFININKRSKVDIGDIIMPMIGTIGNPIIVDEQPNFAIKNVALIKFNNPCVINIYIKYLLNSHYLDYILNKNKRGGTQKFLSLTDIRNMEIPLPPRDLQAKFSEIVKKVDSQKAILHKSLTELENNFNSLMQRAFKGELFND